MITRPTIIGTLLFGVHSQLQAFPCFKCHVLSTQMLWSTLTRQLCRSKLVCTTNQTSAMDAMSYAYKTQLSWGRLVVLDYKTYGKYYSTTIRIYCNIWSLMRRVFEVLDYHVPFNVLDLAQVPKLQLYIGIVVLDLKFSKLRFNICCLNGLK